MDLVALLPMKAHSERVPGKNFRPLLGKPLFRWMLDELLSMPEVSKVVINTDGAHLLKGLGLPETGRVLVRERRPELRGDFVSMNRILADDLEAVPADLYLQTHTTNPFLAAATIRQALGALRASPAHDSLFSVTRHQSRFYWADGRPANHDPQQLLRTQDLPPLYEENSNLYLFTRESFAATGARIGAKPMMMDIPLLEAVDIDVEAQWTLAEAIGRATGRGA